MDWVCTDDYLQPTPRQSKAENRLQTKAAPTQSERNPESSKRKGPRCIRGPHRNLASLMKLEGEHCSHAGTERRGKGQWNMVVEVQIGDGKPKVDALCAQDRTPHVCDIESVEAEL